MLEIKNLTGGYVHVPVLKDVSFTVESGQLVGLIGLNGAGKSTTINEIIGLLTPYSGESRLTVSPCEKMRPTIASRLAISQKRLVCMRN